MGKKRIRCRSKSCVRSRKRRVKAETIASSKSPPSQPKPSLFEDYHSTLGWISDREQYSFVAALKRPLPTCFRIRSENAKQEFRPLLQKEVAHAKQLFQQAWQFTQVSPEVRQWLAKNTNTGAISRQEQEPSGFVVANELDPQRAYVLAHRCRATLRERIKSLAVVCHNATKFPNVLAPLKPARGTSARPFDRIVCDVPCSGDGTLRKDLKVWKTWHPSYGIQLHSLQLRIAKRGIALLKVGGMMTYSTCSFHPIENEAVVAALVATGCVEVVPCDAARALRGIRRRPGLTNWQVLDDDCQEQFPQNHPEWPPTLWPPENQLRALQRCIRMVPNDNDSGGFFIALLRKVKEFPVPRKATKRSPIVTPQQQHHQLFAIKEGKKTDGLQTFTRGPTGANEYHLADPLANFLTQSPGSLKLNLVSTGYKSW